MKTVGRYEIVREVGRGGMAIVYVARQSDLDRFVALKELNALHVADPSFAERFLRESRVAGSLSHPNIVTVYDYFEADGTPYIAMEYLERGSLRPYVGNMRLAQIGGVLEGVLAGLAHSEQHGIVHRDLKPENLMVTSEGRVKIADFGIAKATKQLQANASLTAAGATIGTPTYMAPEQAMAKQVGPWTDLYSLGCMAFELFTGGAPFDESAVAMAVIVRQVTEPIPPARTVDPTIDQQISDWIERLLVKDPTDRTQSAREAWDEFEEIIIGLLGPRWHRDSQLREGATAFDPPPGPATPPPRADAPLPPDPEVGPSTPDPVKAVRPPTTDPGFITYEPSLPSRGSAAPSAPETSPSTPARAQTTVHSDLAREPSRPRPAPRATSPRPGIRRGPGRLRALLVLVGVGALGAVAVALVSTRDDEAPPKAPTSGGAARLAAGPLGLAAAQGWEKLAGAVRVPGFALRDADAAAPAGRDDSGAVMVGLAPKSANQPSLLPREFVRALGLRPTVVPDRTNVRLGRAGFPAYRYADLKPLGYRRAVTVYAAPTTVGVANVICVAPQQTTAGFAGDCARMAGSLSARGARGFPLGPSTAYAHALNEHGRALTRSLAAPRRQLRRAKTGSAQSAATRALAAAHERAARTIQQLAVSPAYQTLNARLTGALAAAAAGHRRLSSAAIGGEAGDYKAAASAARAAEGDVAEALASLRAAGYRDLLSVRFLPGQIPTLRRVRPKAGPRTSPTAPRPSQTTPRSSAGPTPAPQATPRKAAPSATPTAAPVTGGNPG